MYPVWGRETLIYRVKLPLVDGRNYNRYNLASWPVPYEKQGYSIKIRVEQKDVGISTTNEDIFHPLGCVGWKPMVCRSGPLFDTHRWSCPRSLIAGDVKHSHNCQVILTRQSNLTLVTEISYGEYVVVTWGETFETHCKGKPSNRQRVGAGTCLITVPSGCIVMGKGVTLTGLIERIGHASVKALRVLATNILNITTILPEEQALSLLKQPHFDHQTPLLLTDLKPLPMPPPPFDWTQHGSRLSFGLLFVLITIGVLATILGCLVWHKRETFISWLRSTPKATTEQVLMLKDQASPPTATDPTPLQYPTNVCPSLAAVLKAARTGQSTSSAGASPSGPSNSPLPAETE